MEKSNSRSESQGSYEITGQHSTIVDSVRLMVSRRTGNGEPVEITGWNESKAFLLLPSRKFDLVCQLNNREASYSGDFLVRTTIDFLVAPPSVQYARMTSDQLGRAVSWGQVTEMRDVKTVSVYSLHPGESRAISIRGFDLTDVMAAFPPDDGAPLWPWLMRINLFVQDRSGKEVASAQRIFSLRPYKSRIESR